MNDKKELMGCGHPLSSVVGSDEGTSYCGDCEREAREGCFPNTAHVKIEQLERSLLHEIEEHDKARRRCEAHEREIERMRTNMYKDRVCGPTAGKNMWTKKKPSEPGLYFVCLKGQGGRLALPAVIVESEEELAVLLPGDEERMELGEFEWFYSYNVPESPGGTDD